MTRKEKGHNKNKCKGERKQIELKESTGACLSTYHFSSLPIMVWNFIFYFRMNSSPVCSALSAFCVLRCTSQERFVKLVYEFVTKISLTFSPLISI